MGFWIALQFLTIIPSPVHRNPRPDEIGSSLIYFPVIGLLTGALLFLINWGLAGILPQTVAAALTLAVWIGISGALHLDGLIDTCDGLAGNTPQKRLEIMADSHTGAYGISGAVIVLLLKYAAIASLPVEWRLEAWLLAPALGSWTMVLALFAFPYARRDDGLGFHFKQGANKRRLAAATLLMLAAATGLAGWLGLVLVAAACLITLGTGYFFKTRLGGLTGDVYGAIKEITGATILIMITAIAGIV